MNKFRGPRTVCAGSRKRMGSPARFPASIGSERPVLSLTPGRLPGRERWCALTIGCRNAGPCMLSARESRGRAPHPLALCRSAAGRTHQLGTEVNLNPLAALAIAFAIGACSGPTPDPTPAGMESWRVVRVENPTERPGIIHYSGGQRFQTALMRVEHLGELPAGSKAPFLVLAGYGCNDCDINRALYIHSPSDGPIQGESHPRYPYPGSLTEWRRRIPRGRSSSTPAHSSENAFRTRVP